MDSPTGPSMYVTRTCIEQIGLMDESFFLYWEEVDWAIRAKASMRRRLCAQVRGSPCHGHNDRLRRRPRQTIGLLSLSRPPKSASLRPPASSSLVSVDPVRDVRQKRGISGGRIDPQFRRREPGSDRRPARRKRPPADGCRPGRLELRRRCRPQYRQRCAEVMRKSRNAWTRATLFISSV